MHRSFALIAAAALMAAPVVSQARGFDFDFTQGISGPMKLEIVVSDDLAYRANNLPKKMSDRPVRRLNASFGNNGRYGEKEITYLIKDMNEELTHDFAKRGITLSDTASTTLRVTIEDVKPNRPTFKQLSTDSSISFQSFGIGGAEVSAEITSASGEIIGQVDYDYYSNLGDTPFPPVGTWEDTQRAFSRFSRSLSKKIAAAGAAK